MRSCCLSNIITALSSFFLAKDLDLLVSGPVDWLRLYGAKLIETVIASSWMVALMAIPVFTAYGWVYHGGWGFGLFAGAVFVPFLVIPAVIGSAITLVLVNIFPARRTRDILSVVAVVAAAGIVLLFRLVRPEQLANPEKFKSLVDFVAVLRTPTSPLLPSEWVQRSVMGLLNEKADWLAVYMLWTTAAAFVVLGALLHRALYVTGFSKAQESGAALGAERDLLALPHARAAPARRAEARAGDERDARFLPRHHAVVAADPARRAGGGVRVQHQVPATEGRGDHPLAGQRGARS